MSTVAARPVVHRIRAYARLAKLDVFDYYLSLVVVWSLVGPALWWQLRTVAVLVVLLAGQVCVAAAMVCFDDVTGYRDGSDAANYGPDAPARRLARKPLLAGTLTEREAIRFGWVTAAAGTALWVLAVALAPHRPLWTILLAALCVASAVQYSWGLKLSYRGGQEVFLAGLGVGWVLAPYGLLAGDPGPFVVVQAVLFGLGPLLFGVWSNTNDIPGDAAVGRITVATRVSARGNRTFIGALTVAEIVLVFVAPWAGAPWWFPLALLPLVAARVGQLVTGLARGDILTARRLGIRAHRLTVVLLVGVNLVAAAFAA
ncbi:MAG TPA: UbiA family prenyltransferase [Actinocatenispora sp.]